MKIRFQTARETVQRVERQRLNFQVQTTDKEKSQSNVCCAQCLLARLSAYLTRWVYGSPDGCSSFRTADVDNELQDMLVSRVPSSLNDRESQRSRARPKRG